MTAVDVEAVSPGDSKPIEIARVVHTLKRWSGMAGPDAAITVFHFGKTLAAIRSGLSGLPSVKGKVNHSKLRAAAKRFRQEFPDFEQIRHAVGHRAELTVSANFIRTHSFEGAHFRDAKGPKIYDHV
jgi:hypothetical protein